MIVDTTIPEKVFCDPFHSRYDTDRWWQEEGVSGILEREGKGLVS